MRVRAVVLLVVGLLLLLQGLRPAAADPRAVVLVPSEGTAAPPPTSALETTPGPDKPAARKPLYRRWWLWTIVGAVVAQGAVTGAILGTPARLFIPTIPGPSPGLSSLVRF